MPRDSHGSAVLLLLKKFMGYAKFGLSDNIKNSDCETMTAYERKRKGKKDGENSLCH